MRKKCDHCWTWFDARYPSVKLCLACWRKRERAFAEYDDLCHEVDYLIGETHRLRSALAEKSQQIPPDMLKRLIRLCHPDRHNNSELANEVTKWLLDQRTR
jgi:hypothetical protein